MPVTMRERFSLVVESAITIPFVCSNFPGILEAIRVPLYLAGSFHLQSY
jgi:hypothetical protein